MLIGTLSHSTNRRLSTTITHFRSNVAIVISYHNHEMRNLNQLRLHILTGLGAGFGVETGFGADAASAAR